MSHTLRYKLFGIGKLPAELRTELGHEAIHFEFEGIPVTRHFSGTVPRKGARGEVTSYSGALVATDRRIVGFGHGGGSTVDVAWSDASQYA